MRTTSIAAVAMFLAGCSSASGSGGSASGSQLQDFLGTWKLSGTTTITCPNGAPTTDTNGPLTLDFTPKGAGFTTGGTCEFDFSVSGDTATLSNAPHCVSDVDGGAEAFTYQHYTLTTSDGTHLTGSVSGSIAFASEDGDGGVTVCSYTDTFTGTRTGDAGSEPAGAQDGGGASAADGAATSGDASDDGAPASSSGPAIAVPLSAGDSTACALTAAGGVTCWGSTLGATSSGGSSTMPTPVQGLASGVIAVSVGGSDACAITAGGGVQCWGDNSLGGLGNGATGGSSATPVPVTGLTSGVRSVSVGNGFACAVTASGAVECWGGDDEGELGIASSGATCGVSSCSSTPMPVPGLTSGAIAVSAGNDFACALTSGGGVQCWGNNFSGELGNGSTSSVTGPVQVTGLTSGVTAISAGYASACALTSVGGVECWGYASDGDLGNGSSEAMLAGRSTVPVPVTGLTSGVTAVSAGSHFACAIVAGAVQCWGDNSQGELGVGPSMPTCGSGSSQCSSVPVPVTALGGRVTAISAGGAFACAIAAGSAQCWGLNLSGDLGATSMDMCVDQEPCSLAPVPVVGFTP